LLAGLSTAFEIALAGDGGAGVDFGLIDRRLYRNGGKGGSSRTVRRGLLPALGSAACLSSGG
jgi:hypothetical protein